MAIETGPETSANPPQQAATRVAALYHKGRVAFASGRFSEAVNAFAEAATDRAAVGARAYLVMALAKTGRSEEAWVEAKSLLAENPRHALVQVAAAASAMAMGMEDKAAAAAISAAEQSSGDSTIVSMAIDILRSLKSVEVAIGALAGCHASQPASVVIVQALIDLKRSACDWDELPLLEAQLAQAIATGDSNVHPWSVLFQSGTALQQRDCAIGRIKSLKPVAALPFRPPGHGSSSRLKVGFVSSGFGPHAVTVLAGDMLASLQAHSFDVHLLATRMFPGSAWVPDSADYAGIHDVSSASAASIAALVQTLRLDVLIDVDGWADGGRPEIFSYRAAPIQLAWLGYPGTTGAPWFDGIVVDRFIVPPDQQDAFSESVAYLPRCYQPTSPPEKVPSPPERVACGLPAEACLVYGCFNEPTKMGPRSFARMLDVLAQVPESVLWLLEPAGRGADRLRHLAAGRGVDPDRLVFRPKLPYLSYLGHYRHVDMVLDTEIYNGHTVSSDALQMGVPVLTRPGEVMAARVAGSLNHHLGLDDCNVATDEAFVAQATRFARDPAWRDSVRARLRHARGAPGVFDPAGYANDLAGLVFDLLARTASAAPPADPLAAASIRKKFRSPSGAQP